MKAAAIISEYNPFHLGHKYQIDKLRCEGFDIIIAIMSGSIVQRGELACADKCARAEAAVRCGADIVIELPTKFACTSAEFFARGGVFAAEKLCADVLSFGSECGDISQLYAHSLSERTASPGKRAAEAELSGTGFLSNDILAIEYLRAIRRLGARITPITHKRIGGAYLSEDANTENPSASAIRKLLAEGKTEEIFKCMPEDSYDTLLPSFKLYDAQKRDERLFDMLTAKFMFTSAEQLSRFAFLSGGLAERMKKAACSASSLDEFYLLSSAKLYTSGRIRRASLCALCEIEASKLSEDAEYLTLLASNAKGREYISSHSFDIEICSNVRQKKKYPSFEIEKKFDSLYAFVCAKKNEKREIYYNKTPYIHQS